MAKALNVPVHNTPGINAPSVADFIFNRFHLLSEESKVSVIGFGDIGNFLLKKCSSLVSGVNVFSRRLSQVETETHRRRELDIPSTTVVSRTLSESFRDATHVVRLHFRLPLKQKGC